MAPGCGVILYWRVLAFLCLLVVSTGICVYIRFVWRVIAVVVAVVVMVGGLWEGCGLFYFSRHTICSIALR